MLNEIRQICSPHKLDESLGHHLIVVFQEAVSFPLPDVCSSF